MRDRVGVLAEWKWTGISQFEDDTGTHDWDSTQGNLDATFLATGPSDVGLGALDFSGGSATYLATP